MSESEEPGFAFVRQPECAALMRCKASAALAFIYIRSVLAKREDQPFLCGSRDFQDCGLGRDAAAGALRELEREGLIRCDDRGSFTRGKKAAWRLVNTRSAGVNTAGKPANPKANTAGLSANPGRKTRQLAANTAGKPATPKDTPAPAEQEQGAGVCSVEAEARSARLDSFKVRKRRIGEAAKVAAMSDQAFEERAGGHDAADYLARLFERGNLTVPQLRAHLVDTERQAFEDVRTVATPRTIARERAA